MVKGVNHSTPIFFMGIIFRSFMRKTHPPKLFWGKFVDKGGGGSKKTNNFPL